MSIFQGLFVKFHAFFLPESAANKFSLHMPLEFPADFHFYYTFDYILLILLFYFCLPIAPQNKVKYAVFMEKNTLSLTAKEQAIQAILDSQHAENIELFHFDDNSPVRSAIIATATSRRHAAGLADAIQSWLISNNSKPLGIEGRQNSEWIFLDLGDLATHIFLAETRGKYRLEELFSR